MWSLGRLCSKKACFRALPPRDLERIPPGYPINLVLRVTEHQTVRIFPSSRQTHRFLQGFVRCNSNREEPCPAGTDTKRRSSDIEMRESDDGISRCTRISLGNMGDHEMRCTTADRIVATFPGSDHGGDISAHRGAVVHFPLHPVNSQSRQPMDFCGIVYNKPPHRLGVTSRCCVAGDVQHCLYLLSWHGFFCVMPNCPALFQVYPEIFRSKHASPGCEGHPFVRANIQDK